VARSANLVAASASPALAPRMHSRPPRDVAAEAHAAIPPAQGLFDPANDRDACERAKVC
jgi:hypothetical protein